MATNKNSYLPKLGYAEVRAIHKMFKTTKTISMISGKQQKTHTSHC